LLAVCEVCFSPLKSSGFLVARSRNIHTFLTHPNSLTIKKKHTKTKSYPHEEEEENFEILKK